MKFQLFLFIILHFAAYAFCSNNSVLQVVDEYGNGISHAQVKMPVSGTARVIDVGQAGYANIPHDFNKDNDSLIIIAMGFENYMIPLKEIQKEDSIHVVLKVKPYDLEAVTIQSGQCQEWKKGVQKRRGSGYWIHPKPFGLQITPDEKMEGKYFKGIEYFIANTGISKTSSPFHLEIREFTDHGPGEIIFRTPAIVDYKLKWYSFLRNGTWNTYHLKDTAVAVPEEGFVIAVDLGEKDKELTEQAEKNLIVYAPGLGLTSKIETPLMWYMNDENEWRKYYFGQEKKTIYNIMVRAKYSNCKP